MMSNRSGGYDVGYAACPCFWGSAPSTFVVKLLNFIPSLTGLRVLDAGCGEGKNAAFMANLGADVTATDISPKALANAGALHPDVNVAWRCADIADERWLPSSFDVVIAYGLFHCMSSPSEIATIQERLSVATKLGGYHVVCTFNDRKQDLAAHPDLNPCLEAHSFYASLYNEWSIEAISDEDLHETHPHNGILHAHSLTRIIARKSK